MTRNEAKQAGLVTYHTGRPCHRGHAGERYVSTGQCVDCLKEDRKAKTLTPRTVPAPSALDWQLGNLDAEYDGRIERVTASLRADLNDAVRRLTHEYDVKIRKQTEALIDQREAQRARLHAQLAATEAGLAQQAEAKQAAAAQQAEREQRAQTVARRNDYIKGLRKCRAKIESGREVDAAAYVWAVSMARCEEIQQEDVCKGRDAAYQGVQVFMLHPDDVTATMEALKAYAPPVKVVPPVVVPEVASSSSDWLHQ